MKGQDIERYISYLKKELSIYKERFSNYKLHTIFIGGGTPSAIHERYIIDILEYIYKNYDVSDLKEITIELNPGTVTKTKCEAYKSIGINRVSVGAQSLNDKKLQMLGRIHNCNDIRNTLYLLRRAGFDNINVDLIFGLPDETLEDVDRTLKQIIEYEIEHISYYSLIIEEETLFNEWHKKGLISLPNEDLERQMYHYIVDFLIRNSYNHYEISNFSKSGFECKHNLSYWKIKPYLGVGLNSHSNSFGKRFWNTSDLNAYYAFLSQDKLPIEGEETIDKSMEMAEYSIMGLRLIKGISKEEFCNRFKQDIYKIYREAIDKHIKNGLLKDDSKNLTLTKKGLDLANLVEVDFMP
jgi:oxygen-independent coproporphyrinogen-3 oxidase